jgi:hypothetical protein
MGLISSIMGEIVGDDVDLGNLYQNIGATGQQAQRFASQLASELPGMTAFKPFTVTSGTSQVQATPEGGFNIGLSPQALANQQALQAQANYYMTQPVQGFNRLGALGTQTGDLASQFLSQASVPTMGQEQDVYNRIRAMQSFEEQRQRMALEERLFNQGRGGVSTNMYGGTPEQLAMAKAQAEAQNQASLMAMQQAQAQQLQQADLGQRFGTLSGQLAGTGMGLQQAQQQLGLGALGASYLPEQQALGMLSAAAPYASIADIARRQGAGLYGETAMSGMDALMAGQMGQGTLIGGIVPGVVQGLGNVATAGVKGFFDLFK